MSDEKPPQQTQLARRPDGGLERGGNFEHADGELEAEVHGRHVDGMPPGVQAVALQRSTFLKLTSHKGPLPSPEQFRQYESICPGAADRIIKMAENEGDHRRGLEKQMVTATIATERRGQYFGALVYLISLGVGAALLYAGVPVAGIATIITTLGVMFASAISNRIDERKLRQLEIRTQQKSLEDQTQKEARRGSAPRRKKNKKQRN